MKEDSDRHFQGIQQIIPLTKRLMLFDYDDEERAFHPQPDNLTLHEWNRKNIENYLLVPEAWIRAALRTGRLTEQELFSAPIQNLIRDFFAHENLTLPPAQSWRKVRANIFQVVNGKKLLFENQDSLFQRLRNYQLPAPIQSVFVLELTREIVATNMLPDEIHEDVHQFFAKLGGLISPTRGKPQTE